MPELRWILLIAGLVFLGALALWESRRQRRVPPQHVEGTTQHRFREPSLGLPDIRPRDAAPDLPVVQVDDDDSMIGLRVDGVRIEQDQQGPEESSGAVEEDIVPLAREAHPDAARAREVTEELDHLDDTVPRLEQLPQPPEPIVDWPPEDQRRLAALRVVAAQQERFAGRAVRLALAAEGFLHGRFSIFHLPGADGRVIISAASVTQPGSFDLQAMDTQRYGGLGLFAVLPGPLPADEAIDVLVQAARNLAERLQGALQDEHGLPLDDDGVAALRSRLSPAESQPATGAEAPEASS
jgi:cell division protein ZipA